MNIKQCFKFKNVDTEYDFIRKEINIFLGEKNKEYESFRKEFFSFLLKSKFSIEAYQWINEFLDGKPLSQGKKDYLKINLDRVFQNEEHLKGLVGEHLLAFYYLHVEKNHVASYGPKARSSAEPGIDYIAFVNDTLNKYIKFIVWETKTTKNTVTTRASKVYDFFSANGSFNENIDTEIKSVQEEFKNTTNNDLKELITHMSSCVVDKDLRMNIGGCVISPLTDTTTETFKGFAECQPGLTKEQRTVKFIFFELLSKLQTDLRDLLWKKL